MAPRSRPAARSRSTACLAPSRPRVAPRTHARRPAAMQCPCRVRPRAPAQRAQRAQCRAPGGEKRVRTRGHTTGPGVTGPYITNLLGALVTVSSHSAAARALGPIVLQRAALGVHPACARHTAVQLAARARHARRLPLFPTPRPRSLAGVFPGSSRALRGLLAGSRAG